MKHEYTDKIKCPYCDWEDEDSWEFNQESGNHTCGDCGEEFEVTRDVSITYCTSPINCSEKGVEHKWQFKEVYQKVQEFRDGVWYNLSESEYSWYMVSVCTVCLGEEYRVITKEEYEAEK